MAAQGEMDVRKAASSNSGPLPKIPVTELMGGGREAVLVHDGTEYRLRLTSNGKLILTK
jgi:hemin uptake protein HemP